MSAPVTMTPTLMVGERRTLLDLSPYDGVYFHDFDVFRSDSPSFAPSRRRDRRGST